MSNSTAVLPKTFSLDILKGVDPRFYRAKEVVLGLPRKDSTLVPPENAIVVPLTKQVLVVAIGRTAGIYRVEETKKAPHVVGSV